MVYRAICERLETIDHISEASECVVQMVNELGMETISNGEQKEWVTSEWASMSRYGRQPGDRFPAAFRQRCAEQLEYLGDEAANSQQHDAAVLRYSAALSLDLLVPQVFIKRSKVYLANELWQDALHDANQVRGPCLAWVVLIDSKLGNSTSIISMGPSEGVDGMGEGKFNQWFVEGSIGCRS